MHPLMRLLCFIIFAAFVSLGEYPIIGFGFIILSGVWIVSGHGPSVKAWQMLKRLKLFYFSILLVFLAFTPGEIMLSLFGNWYLTYEGLNQAAEKILALCLLVLGVETLLRLTPRNSILSGLFYLSAPLRYLGLNREQFIIRIMLTLDLVTNEPLMMPKKTKKKMSDYFNDITQQIADKITQTINHQVPSTAIAFDLHVTPSYLQWLWPSSLLLLFWCIS